jgi:hypothetical protein
MMQNPFAILTFIVAPAILTNASTVLALSTSNRIMRVRDHMHELSRETALSGGGSESQFFNHVASLETQSSHLLQALRCFYLTLGSFALATLVALLGAVACELESSFCLRASTVLGIALGLLGVGELCLGCRQLLRATRLSLASLHEEADELRLRKPCQQPRN